MPDENYGTLLQGNNIKLNRQWFEQMARLIGVKVIYKSPLSEKPYTQAGEVQSNYSSPVAAWVIFNEHPEPRTMKKLGWDSELDTDAIVMSVPYNLENVVQGGLFIIPSAFDNTKGRVFQITKLSSIMIYPATITCELVPYYSDDFPQNNLNHDTNNFNLLENEE